MKSPEAESPSVSIKVHSSFLLLASISLEMNYYLFVFLYVFCLRKVLKISISYYDIGISILQATYSLI